MRHPFKRRHHRCPRMFVPGTNPRCRNLRVAPDVGILLLQSLSHARERQPLQPSTRLGQCLRLHRQSRHHQQCPDRRSLHQRPHLINPCGRLPNLHRIRALHAFNHQAFNLLPNRQHHHYLNHALHQQHKHFLRPNRHHHQFAIPGP